MENSDGKQPAELPPDQPALEERGVGSQKLPAPQDDVATGPRLIVLGGIAYQVFDFQRRTVLVDHYLQSRMRRIGADKLLPNGDETSTAFVIRLQSHIIDSNQAHELLAGFIAPQDRTIQDWTLALAKATADHIAALTTPEDRELVAELCIEIAFGFFRQALEQLARAQVLAATAEHSLSSKPTPH